MMFKKKLPATEAIALDFTIPQRVQKCPRAEWMMFKKKLPATEAIALDFTIPQRVQKCPRADGIKANPLYISNYPRLHRVPTSSQTSKSGWCFKKGLPATAANILDSSKRAWY
jgi:hypothetical protein